MNGDWLFQIYDNLRSKLTNSTPYKEIKAELKKEKDKKLRGDQLGQSFAGFLPQTDLAPCSLLISSCCVRLFAQVRAELQAEAAAGRAEAVAAATATRTTAPC